MRRASARQTTAHAAAHVLAAALAAAALAPAARAAWEAVPELELRAAANDNPRLAPEGAVADSANSTVLDARVQLSTFNERGSLRFEPRLRSNVYGDRENDDLEGEDWFLDGRGEYRWRSATAGFRSFYRRQAIQRAELEDVEEPDLDEPDLGEAPDVDSGRLELIDQDQERYTLRPYVDFALSPRSSIRLALTQTEVAYTRANTDNRTGFDDTTVSAGVLRRLDEQNSVSATLLVSDYEAEGNENTTDTFAIEGEATRALSNLWTFDLTAGVERNEFRFLDDGELVDNASTDFTLGIGLRKRTERSTYSIRVRRLINPSTSGFMTERNELRTYLDHEFRPRLSARFGLRAQRSRPVGDVSRSNDRDYVRAEFSIAWALEPRWSLTGGYNFTSQEFPNEGVGMTDSNAFFVGIRYQGRGRRGAAP